MQLKIVANYTANISQKGIVHVSFMIFNPGKLRNELSGIRIAFRGVKGQYNIFTSKILLQLKLFIY